MIVKVMDICSTDPSDPTYCVTPADIEIDRAKVQILYGIRNPGSADPDLQGAKYPRGIYWHLTKCLSNVRITNFPLNSLISSFVFPLCFHPFPASTADNHHNSQAPPQLAYQDSWFARVAFAIQGEVNSAQNYTCIIDNLDDLVYSNATSHVHNVSLHFIRYSLKETKPTVPVSVSDHVFFNQDHDYVDYHAYLSGISAFISAFADENPWPLNLRVGSRECDGRHSIGGDKGAFAVVLVFDSRGYVCARGLRKRSGHDIEGDRGSDEKRDGRRPRAFAYCETE